MLVETSILFSLCWLPFGSGNIKGVASTSRSSHFLRECFPPAEHFSVGCQEFLPRVLP